MKEKKTKAQIKNESTNRLGSDQGTLAMGERTFATSAPVFHRFLKHSESRDGVGYCVFGKVTEGMETVDKIAGVRTGNRGPHGDVPVEDVTIKSAKVQE